MILIEETIANQFSKKQHPTANILMRNLFIFTLYLSLSFSSALACLNTYQYKIFPIGTLDGDLVTIDFQIQRSEDNSPARHVKIGFGKGPQEQQIWRLKSYISTYDKHQKLQFNLAQDIGQARGEDYTKKLKTLYQTALAEAVKKYPKMVLFNPQGISFCNFNKDCDLVSIKYDVEQKKDFVFYNGQSYEIGILKDSSYIGFNNSLYYANHSTAFYLSSSRTYINKTGRLLVCHYETGTNLSFYEDEKHSFVPDLEFVDLRNAIYQEPVLHHGFGYDVLVWLE